MTATFGCVVLTLGGRPAALHVGLASLLAQRDVEVDVLVVGNGWEPTDLPEGVRGLGLAENIGATAGRNAGVPAVSGEYLLFLDDDAALPDVTTLHRIALLLAADPQLAVVQPRVVDPTGRPGQRRHVPRLIVGDPSKPSDVTSFWEGAVVIRRSVFTGIGGFSEALWYGHEGLDFGWRVMDAGYRIRYAGDLVAHHPAVATPTHNQYRYITARNRVWVVRQHLPWPIAVVHLAIWFALTMSRLRSIDAVRETVRGWLHGFTQSPAPRSPISWRTVWRMCRAGRPPVV